jgi:hypothetical protein
MANEPYDPYIPGASKGDPAAQGTSNPKTAAIQAQIDDTVRSHVSLHPFPFCESIWAFRTKTRIFCGFGGKFDSMTGDH